MPRTTSTTSTTVQPAVAPVSADELAGWTTARLVEYIGGFSNPSKMPGYAYGIPAADCTVGGRLRDVEGSTCQHCYAFERGAYAWRTVKAAYRRRADRLSAPMWAEAVAEVLNRRAGNRNGDVFRWHDSGDLQSVAHLREIVRVAEMTPTVRHWLPTREYRIVAEYIDRFGGFPENLNVRLSAHMIGGRVPTFPRLRGHVTVSTVTTDGMDGAHDCPSRHQQNECGDCRACWSRNVAHVDYRLH